MAELVQSDHKKPAGWVKKVGGAFSKAGRAIVNAPQHLLDLQRDASKAFESLLRRAWAHQRELRILVTGKTGQGKSTLINGILGARVAVEGAGAKRCTTQVEMFSKTIKGVPIKVFDSPGLQDRTANEEEYIQGMRETCQELSLVIYCTKMINTRLTDDDKNAMVKLTRAFGEGFWNYSVFVLTFANLENVTRKDDRDVDEEEPDEDDDEGWKELEKRRFIRRLELWKEELQNFLVNEVGVSKNIATKIPVIPTGDNKKSRINREYLRLPDRNNWFNNFWEACCLRVKETRLFLQVNSDRMVAKDEGDDDDLDDEKNYEDDDEPFEVLSPEEEKRDLEKNLETIERFKAARNSFIEHEQQPEEEMSKMPPITRTRLASNPEHSQLDKADSVSRFNPNRHSTSSIKIPPPVAPKPVRQRKRESDYGLPTIPMDGLKPGAAYRKPQTTIPPTPPSELPSPKPSPPLPSKSSPLPLPKPSPPKQQKEVATVPVTQPTEPRVVQVTNHLVNQNIHIHPTLVKNVAVETVRRGFGESVADACRAAFDNIIKKPSKWFVGLFRKKK